MEQKVWPCLELRRLFIDYLILKKIKTEWISRVLWGRKDVDLNRLPTVGLNSWQHKILVMKLSAHQGFRLGWEPDYKGVAQGSLCAWNSGGGYTWLHTWENEMVSLSHTHTLKTHRNCLNSNKASCFLKNTVSHRIFHCMDRLSLCWGSSGSCGHWLSCSVVCGILVPWQGV